MVTKYLFLVFAVFCAASAAPDGRIIGGTPTTIEQYPFLAAYIYHYPNPNIYIQRCVGSVISSYHVLTTAFCFTGANLDNMRIRAGSTNSKDGGVLVGISQVIKHPDYVESPRAADIAITFVKEPLKISNTINIVFIPPAGLDIPDGLSFRIISWGFESEQGPQLETLNTISLNKIPLEDCQKSFANENVTISDAVICASAEGKGICNGDSGAPLVYNTVLLGLSSVYKGCGNNSYPDVFTRIDSYTEWIVEVAKAPESADSVPRIGNL